MKPFPYRKITKKEAIEDYNKLVNLPEKKALDRSNIGNKATDYLFQKERSKVRIRGRKSHLDSWKDEQERAKIIKFAKQLRKTNNPTDADLRASIRFKHGSINQFRPAVAKWIYQRFKPKRILDFSAGWGGRLLGAMALNIDYVGIDANTNLYPLYKKMLEIYPSDSEVKLIFKPAEEVDFKELGKFDMIFTSPPYFDLEIYPNMKNYGSSENFLNEFFIPVVRESFKRLNKDGYLILNMPSEMKDVLKSLNICKGRIDSVKMPIANRFNDGTERYELIYICKN